MKNPVVESVARLVHDAMRFDRDKNAPFWAGGNSDAETEARGTAREILKMFNGGKEWGVVLRLDYETADNISLGISDVLCWLGGFMAAYSGDHAPFSVERLRDINIKLKEAMERSKE